VARRREIFCHCTLVGDVSHGAVATNQWITQPMTLTANAPVEVLEVLDQGTFDMNNGVDAQDCKIFVDGVEASDIYEWEPTTSQQTLEWTPGGQRQTYERRSTFKHQLTITKQLVRDSLLFRAFLDSLLPGGKPVDVTVQVEYAGPSS
jgi:hypothetical protein